MKENRRLVDELKLAKQTLLKEMEDLISQNEALLNVFETSTKDKDKRAQIKLEDLGKEYQNNPFAQSIVENSMVRR